MKLDTNDKLYSQLKRMHREVCQRCGKPALLQTCHIFSRKYYSTRFCEENSVVLCFSCHSWFDSHKIMACLFNPEKRVFDHKDESFHFLVQMLGYTWEQLENLYHKSQEPFRGYKSKKSEISKHLRQRLKVRAQE